MDPSQVQAAAIPSVAPGFAPYKCSFCPHNKPGLDFSQLWMPEPFLLLFLPDPPVIHPAQKSHTQIEEEVLGISLKAN